MPETIKKIKLSLVGLDGNAFALMGAFSKQARREGWTKPEIDAVLNTAMDGNYYNLVSTLSNHCIEDDPQGFMGTGGEIDPNDFEDDTE